MGFRRARARAVPTTRVSTFCSGGQQASCPPVPNLALSALFAVRRECPPVVAAEIQSIYDTACSLTPPSPPRPPAPPPPPPIPFADRFPPPPSPPPPQPYLEIRTKADEKDYDRDCQLISYAACKNAVADYAAANEGILNVLRVSVAPCEGIADEPSCFEVCIRSNIKHHIEFCSHFSAFAAQGCQFGGAHGGLYRFLLPDMQAEFNTTNSYRCSEAEMPFCACGNPASLPPGNRAPPPPYAFTENWHPQPSYVEGQTPVLGGGITDSAATWTADEGQVSTLTKRLVNGRTIDLALRSSHRVVECPGNDDGEQTCSRFCGQEHLGLLRAFAVTGAQHTPPPPRSPPPYVAPSSPLPPWNPFSECENTCVEEGKLATGDTKCRDGGKVQLWLLNTLHTPQADPSQP